MRLINVLRKNESLCLELYGCGASDADCFPCLTGEGDGEGRDCGHS